MDVLISGANHIFICDKPTCTASGAGLVIREEFDFIDSKDIALFIGTHFIGITLYKITFNGEKFLRKYSIMEKGKALRCYTPYVLADGCGFGIEHKHIFVRCLGTYASGYAILGVKVVEARVLFLTIFENNGQPVGNIHFTEHFIGLGIEMQARQMRVVDLFQSKIHHSFSRTVDPAHSRVD